MTQFAEEALKTRLFPGIAFRGQDAERRPWVIGTALDVWQIIRAWQDHPSFEVLVESSDLTERQARLALAYYDNFPEEIDSAIAADRRPIESLRAAHPTVPVIDYV